MAAKTRKGKTGSPPVPRGRTGGRRTSGKAGSRQPHGNPAERPARANQSRVRPVTHTEPRSYQVTADTNVSVSDRSNRDQPRTYFGIVTSKGEAVSFSLKAHAGAALEQLFKALDSGRSRRH